MERTLALNCSASPGVWVIRRKLFSLSSLSSTYAPETLAMNRPGPKSQILFTNLRWTSVLLDAMQAKSVQAAPSMRILATSSRMHPIIS